MKQLFEDMLAAIIFLVVYLVSGDIFIATGVAIAAGLAQFGYLKIKRRPIDAMQWGSLALVIVLGGVTIATRDGRFIMMKPSIIHFAIAAIMLRRGWMGRYLPRIATDNLSESVIVNAGYAWAALMAGLASPISSSPGRSTRMSGFGSSRSARSAPKSSLRPASTWFSASWCAGTSG